jgi:hypothetical protein
MTKEEIIMRGKQLGFPRLSKKSHDNQATMITTIVEEAVRLEREACAELVYNSPPSDEYESQLKAVYDAIQARGE